MIGRTIDDLVAGETAEIVRLVTVEDIRSFVEAVGDDNPLHGDLAYAATTPFREPIAPGIFTAGLISAVLGTRLPGPGVIYLSQSLKFLKPVRAGDVITARVEVLEVLRERKRVRLATACLNQRDEEVLVGEAWVMPSRTTVVHEGRAAPVSASLSLALQPWAWTAHAMRFWATLGLSMLAGLAPRR